MYKLVRNIVLVVVVLAFFTWAWIPPKEKLRLGKDLAGGVSLVYSVQLKPGDPPDTVDRVIEVVKERIDPKGLMEISVAAQGRDRIEITMPLPNEEVKALKKAYEAELALVADVAITDAELDRLLGLPASDREAELAKLEGLAPGLSTLVRDAMEAGDRARSARADLDAVSASATPEQQESPEFQETLTQLVDAAGAAAVEFEEARARVLSLMPTVPEIRRALELSNEPKQIFDSKQKKNLTFDSPRQEALKRLNERYPGAKSTIDGVLSKFAAYEAKRRTLDDPADLIRLLKGAGVLTFRIGVAPGEHPEEERLRRELHEVGPRNVRAPDAAWYKINKIDSWYQDIEQFQALSQAPSAFFGQMGYVAEEYDGEYYMLLWDVRGSRLTPAEGRWSVARAYQSVDEIGRPAIAFEMDTVGGQMLGDLTKDHVGDKMAVLLDDQVYTAPNLLERISTNAQIKGDFTDAERNYVIRVLAAGSLQAKLSPEPISRNEVGPDLGIDNLRAGLKAGVIALAVIGAFMIVYYFGFGVVAVICLLCNAVVLVGAMALNQAAFTLPGIAGIVLTFGMAVDANVLIYERVREELESGETLKNAMRLGYQRALSSIVDGNVTNLIVCVVLAQPQVSTQEIRGFAITLGIGVITTLFCSLVVSRVIFAVLIDWVGVRKMSMLPMKIPAIGRALHPSIDWIRMRWVFVGISAVYVGLGLVMCVIQGPKMLDNEFRGGTQVTLQFKDDPQVAGSNILQTRQQVQDAIRRAAEAAPTTDPVRGLVGAEVLPVNPRDDGVTSDRFVVKTVITDEEAVVETLQTAFADVLDSLPPVSFAAEDIETASRAPVHKVITGVLGDDIQRPTYRGDVRPFRGGAAIVLENLTPQPSLKALEARLTAMREQPDYSGTLARRWEVRVLEGTPEAVSTAVILVADPSVSFFDQEDRWQREVAQAEWSLARDALSRTTSMASVQSFSPVIAETFKAQATAAVIISLLLIGIYIWVRFGSVRYALAASACLFHDVLTCVGLIAVAEILYDLPATQPVAHALGLLPFKIDLNLIAAMLTVVGYSLNDTIIILDRIRETKGKLPYVTDRIINESVNRTISRTLITSGTTLLAVLILYLFGGEGVRAFAFSLLIGIGVGTYSSVAIACPIVWSRRRDRTESAPPPRELAASQRGVEGAAAAT